MTLPENSIDKQISQKAFTAPLVAQSLEKTQIAKYHTKGGHGFSAEDANHFADAIKARQAEIVGTSNELNGADRLVDGLKIQSKYFKTPLDTVNSAFESSSGNYRYSGQVLEVPKDQYEACIKLMEDKISQGRVSGYSNPDDAKKIIHEGTVTYKQARNIARAGNIDSLMFDTKTQAVTSAYAGALSFAVVFAQSTWRGENIKEASKEAVETALIAGSTTFITGVVTAQILRSKAAAMGAVSVRSGMKFVAGNTVGRQTLHRVAAGSLGHAVYGSAAINHVSKLLRSNAISALIVVIVTSIPDFYCAAFSKSISWKQFAKNLFINVVAVVASIIAWVAGTAIGAIIGSIIPVLGTALGGIIGGLAGALSAGVIATIIAKAIADMFVDDDSKALVEALCQEIEELASEYMLTDSELEHVGDQIGKVSKSKWFRKLYKASNKARNPKAIKEFIRSEFEPKFTFLVSGRPKVLLPTPDAIEMEIVEVAEELKEQPA